MFIVSVCKSFSTVWAQKSFIHQETYEHKSGVKRLNTLGHLDQYMAQHGRIVKQSYCETVLVTILFNSN